MLMDLMERWIPTSGLLVIPLKILLTIVLGCVAVDFDQKGKTALFFVALGAMIGVAIC